MGIKPYLKKKIWKAVFCRTFTFFVVSDRSLLRFIGDELFALKDESCVSVIIEVGPLNVTSKSAICSAVSFLNI